MYEAQLVVVLNIFQIKLSPRRVPGFGLADGEVLECLWSFFRWFG